VSELKNKRFLVITELFLPTKGGTAVWFDEVYRRIGDKATHVITAQVPGSEAHDKDHPNTVHRIRVRRHWWLRPESLAMYAKFLTRSLAVGLRFRFDAVHAGRVLPEGLIGWVVARLIRRPIVVYAHGEEITTWRQPAKRRVMRFVYRHADRVIANSDFTQGELIKLDVADDRISLISPGVDIERFRPGLPYQELRESIGLAASQKLILSVGRLSQRKGFDQVIQVLPKLVEKGINVHYALIGAGEDEGRLRGLVEQCIVASRVHFLGHVSMDDLPRWYNAADVFAMPNRDINGDTEGFGMVFAEAGACGKVAIAGLAGGTGAAVLNGLTGFRVDGTSPAAVRDILMRCLSDPELCRKVGETARNRIVESLSWDAVAAHTSTLGDSEQAKRIIWRRR